MTVEIQYGKGWNEVIIDNDCETDKFYRAVDIIQLNLSEPDPVTLAELDSLKWNFDYNGSHLVLYYNAFEGLKIFPASLKKSSGNDNENAIKAGSLISGF